MYSHTTNVRRVIEQEQQRNARVTETSGGYYGPLTGKRYDSLEAMHHYETREAMHRNVDPTDILLEGLTTEQIRALDQRVQHTEQAKLERSASSLATATFLELHPEFADCDANSEELKRCLYARGQWNPEGTRFPTLNELEDAFKTLKAAGVLKLKPN
jgi:hypothetical protein